MPREKDLKRLVRARMKKTGEAYTAARAHVTRTPRTTPTAPRVAPPNVSVPRDLARLAGMKDDVVKEKTGRTWAGWLEVLEPQGAAAMKHGDIALLLSKKFGVGDWWAQMVAVGYERIVGLRERGQRRDGSFEAGKSRTYNVPVERLFDAWLDAKIRRRWLDTPATVRTSSAPKRMRIGWPDGSIIAVEFTAKGKSKASVAVVHTKLENRETSNRLKQYWGERLDALGDVLKRD